MPQQPFIELEDRPVGDTLADGSPLPEGLDSGRAGQPAPAAIKPRKKVNLFLRPVAVPAEHGSWVFLFSPLLIGLFLGGSWTVQSLVLVVAATAGFMIRQPITILVKITSKRRPRGELPAALFWIMVYGVIGAAALGGLAGLGFGYLGLLALPGLPVLAWHLRLVSRRAERKQAGVEVIASGILALAVPAAYWVGRGAPDPFGWLLWILCWLQAGASIVYAYLRLEQRKLPSAPDRATRLRMALPALAFTSVNLAVAGILAAVGWTPAWLPLAFAVQWLESLWGASHPAIGVRPTAVGVRQLLVSSLFTVVFIVVYGI